VYFNYQSGTVTWSNVDPARCGGDAASARKDASSDKAKIEFTALATAMIKGAFP